uniref:Similarity n=1 Tax=Microcystis aeruginosa (strain PCC 7806) TaxID=267872 RepID=A8YBJ7_MICA7|nr:unnamed protein product [Microcystis aeruginosa PCC 7806]
MLISIKSNEEPTYIEPINLCVLCVFVGSFQSLAGGNISYKIHFTHQTQESRQEAKNELLDRKRRWEVMGCYYLKPIPWKQPNRSSGSIPWRIVVE